MKTIYLVWKNPNCNGINPDWLKITGQEFYALVRSNEGKGRFFVKLENLDEAGSDGRIVMETTKSEYVKWRKEKDHSDYIREQHIKSGYRLVSYHEMKSEDDFHGEELIQDIGTDIEADYIKSDELELAKNALSQLTEDEYCLIEYFYLSGEKVSVRGYSAITGIPYKTVHNRKVAVLKKLKNFFK